MYYGAYSNSRGKWSIGFAGSQDGIHWRKIPEALIPAGPPGSWDQDGPNAPCVMRDSLGQYLMWYSGISQPTTAIGLATSLDGIAWSKYTGNPIMVSDPQDKWESFLVTDPRIARVNSTYHMFYQGAPGPYGYQIGYASSTDGLHWTRYSNNPVLTLGARRGHGTATRFRSIGYSGKMAFSKCGMEHETMGMFSKLAMPHHPSLLQACQGQLNLLKPTNCTKVIRTPSIPRQLSSSTYQKKIMWSSKCLTLLVRK